MKWLQILITKLESEMEKWKEHRNQRQRHARREDAADDLQNRWRKLDQMKEAARVTKMRKSWMKRQEMWRSWDEGERVKKDKEAQAVDLIEKYYK
jgi:hypothetical protein